ncbi:unnamed protein product, partial [Ascophyllum nodosum]
VEQEDILTSCCLGSTRTAPSGSGIMPKNRENLTEDVRELLATSSRRLVLNV